MKIIKSFKYSICGNTITNFETGEQELPAQVAEYAIKMGFAENAKAPPLNKAKQTAPRNKAK
jgi:hypothetical protein